MMPNMSKYDGKSLSVPGIKKKGKSHDAACELFLGVSCVNITMMKLSITCSDRCSSRSKACLARRALGHHILYNS